MDRAHHHVAMSKEGDLHFCNRLLLPFTAPSPQHCCCGVFKHFELGTLCLVGGGGGVDIHS